MRIFLDANILFSAAKSDGAVRELLTSLVKASHECWADGYVAEEARCNLAAKAPDGLRVLGELLGLVHVAAAQPHPSTLQATLMIPEKDRPVLAAAIRLKCDVLVTGDRSHFGTFYGKTLDGVTVHSPRSLAETLFV